MVCAAALLASALFSPANASDRWREVPVTIASPTTAVDLVAQASTTDGVAIACFTFTNREPQTLEALVLTIHFRDGEGRDLASRQLDRRGSFAPNVPIVGYTGTGGGTRVANAGQCVLLYRRSMTFPSAALHDVVIATSSLRYAEGR